MSELLSDPVFAKIDAMVAEYRAEQDNQSGDFHGDLMCLQRLFVFVLETIRDGLSPHAAQVLAANAVRAVHATDADVPNGDMWYAPEVGRLARARAGRFSAKASWLGPIFEPDSEAISE